MKITRILQLTIGFSALTLVACVSLPGGLSGDVVTLSEELSEGPLTPINSPAIARFQGKPVTVYFNARGQVVFHPLGDKPQVISQESPPGAALSSLALRTDDKGVYVSWRAKLKRPVEGVGGPGDKIIYARASQDGRTFGPTRRLNQKGGAFMPFMAGDGQGAVYTAWVDERDGTNYQIYFNASHDAGLAWQTQDVRLSSGKPGETTSIDPVFAAEANSVWLAWTESARKDNRTALKIRSSSDRGRTWSDPRNISPQEDSTTTGLHLVKLPTERGNRLVLYWFNQNDLSGAYSDDGGRSWKKFSPLPDVDVQGPTELKVTQDPSGRVILVVGFQPDTKKEDLFVAVSEDGVRFGKPVRLDSGPPHMSTSTNPEIVADGGGRILVGWQDLRSFRTGIYLNYSTDGGKTWLGRDVRLSSPGTQHQANLRGLPDGQGGFHLLWVGYADEKRKQAKAYNAHFERGNLPRGADDPAPDEERLRERVARFWTDRTRADWGGNYDLMDPFFRATTTREYYIVNQFKTIYHDFRIKGVKSTGDGNSAAVTVRYAFEIPEMYLSSGKKVSVPKREEEITEEWIWIDRDWYRAFKDTAGNTVVPR